MANTGQLSTGESGGSQGGTQSPQNSTQTSSMGQSENVQTGTATSLLTGHSGIPLDNIPVPTVNLAAASVRTAPITPASTHHTPNPALLGFSILLFVVAVMMFWTTSRPSRVKSTTK